MDDLGGFFSTGHIVQLSNSFSATLSALKTFYVQIICYFLVSEFGFLVLVLVLVSVLVL